jgi:hypothetical protein
VKGVMRTYSFTIGDILASHNCRYINNGIATREKAVSTTGF